MWSMKLKSVWCGCFSLKVNLSKFDKNDWGLEKNMANIKEITNRMALQGRREMSNKISLF